MLKKIVYSLIPLFVVFFSAEIGLRVSGWPKVTKSFEHNDPYWIVDPNLKEKPVSHKEEGKSFLVSTNSHGLRTSFEAENISDDFKIMTLGCSTTYGWGVTNAEAYPARLQHYIDEANLQKVKVINAGQPGYTSFQGLWLWEEKLKLYEPDVVLIGYVVQDARKAAYSDKSQAILQGDNRFLKDNFFYRSKVYLALRSFIGSIQVEAKERGEGDEGGIYRVPPQDYVENLRELVEKIQDMGATPVLFGYPLERSGYTSEHRKILRAASEELNIPHFDPQPDMEEASRKKRLYFSNDRGHANASGNDVIAKWVFSFLQEKNLLGGG